MCCHGPGSCLALEHQLGMAHALLAMAHALLAMAHAPLAIGHVYCPFGRCRVSAQASVEASRGLPFCSLGMLTPPFPCTPPTHHTHCVHAPLTLTTHALCAHCSHSARVQFPSSSPPLYATPPPAYCPPPPAPTSLSLLTHTSHTFHTHYVYCAYTSRTDLPPSPTLPHSLVTSRAPCERSAAPTLRTHPAYAPCAHCSPTARA
jgi:hypothetical protein